MGLVPALVFASLFLLPPSLGFAADLVAALFTGTPVPLKAAQVRLLSQDITIRAHVDKEARDLCPLLPADTYVTANLHFRNEGSRAVLLMTGFPLDRSFTEETFTGIDLRLESEGTRIRPSFFRDGPGGRVWLVWAQKFPPGQDVPLKMSYIIPRWGSAPCGAVPGGRVCYLPFLLSPSSLWPGKVSRTTVTIAFDRDLVKERVFVSPEPARMGPRKVEWVFPEGEPEKEIIFVYCETATPESAATFLMIRGAEAGMEANSWCAECGDLHSPW